MPSHKEVKSNESIFSQPKKNLWETILEESERTKNEIKHYIESKNTESNVYPNPTVAYLDDQLFPLLHDAMIEMFRRVKEDDCYYRPKTTLIGTDFLSEYLYNMNPKYSKRRWHWKYIFDMDWVQEILEKKPRPFYPFHLVWSRDFAALKIQAYMRGYWARRREDVQEVRQFWRDYKEDRCAKNSFVKYDDMKDIHLFTEHESRKKLF